MSSITRALVRNRGPPAPSLCSWERSADDGIRTRTPGGARTCTAPRAKTSARARKCTATSIPTTTSWSQRASVSCSSSHSNIPSRILEA
eukprot:607805-Pyramimonas_sp.AAC.1